jgi:bleomycin hydrolase
MKRLFVILISMVSLGLFAQSPNGYQFTTIYEVPSTSVKDQNQSGTCWSFSTISFLESEMMRMGKDSVDLSEMYVVRHCYND